MIKGAINMYGATRVLVSLLLGFFALAIAVWTINDHSFRKSFVPDSISGAALILFLLQSSPKLSVVVIQAQAVPARLLVLLSKHLQRFDYSPGLH